MATFPVYQLPVSANKVRFQEPYVSEGLNYKVAGIFPRGIYNGYSVVAIGANKLRFTVDPVRGDSVAATDTYGVPSTCMTVRTTQVIDIDFTGHATFPVYVIIRTLYQLIPAPFSGLTDSKIMTVVAGDLRYGDIKLCKVTGIVAGVVQFSIASGDRDDLGGPLVSRNLFNDLAAALSAQIAAAVAGMGINYHVSAGSASSSVTIGAVVDTLIPPLTISPAAGNYIATFFGNWATTGGGVFPRVGFSIYKGGILVPATDIARYFYPTGSNANQESCIVGKVSVVAGQAVEARCINITSSSILVYSRSLTLLKVQ